jgi:hypothetical protein
MTDDTDVSELFRREGKKQQKNFRLSRELSGVMDSLIESRGQSRYVERTVWLALIEEHGKDRVLELVEDVQDDLKGHERLPEPEPLTLEA